jgi:hypothetical protein
MPAVLSGPYDLGEPMKNKKKITPAVLAANRANAESSTGPQTERGKSNTRHNALRHGILAKMVVLETDEERAGYKEIAESWNAEFSPVGLQEEVQVEEITILSRNLQIVEALVSRELAFRRGVRGRVDGIFHRELKLPISDSDLPLGRGWDGERIVVRAVAGKDESNYSASRTPGVLQNQLTSAVQNTRKRNMQEAGHLEVEAVFVSSLEKWTRYQAALKRDFYRALEKLRALQAERREREGVNS